MFLNLRHILKAVIFHLDDLWHLRGVVDFRLCFGLFRLVCEFHSGRTVISLPEGILFWFGVEGELAGGWADRHLVLGLWVGGLDWWFLFIETLGCCG